HRAVSLMEVLASWAQRNGATADPITAGAASGVAGRLYTGRTTPGDDQAAAPDAAEEDEDGMEYGLLVDPEDADIDPEAELPEPEQGDDAPIFGQESGHKPSPAEARELFARALEEFEEEGRMVVGPKDFTDWCDQNNLSRPWVSARLKEAAMEGRLEATNTTGRWRIVPALTAA
ncbi:sporulation protein SsgA, partial [Streptomyces solisilvae]